MLADSPAGLPMADLLNADATAPVDFDDLRQGASFGLAGGEMDSLYERVARRSRVAASRFRDACFGADLFLDELVGRCMSFRIRGRRYQPSPEFLRRLIAAPPADDRHRSFRAGILDELTRAPELRDGLEGLYLELQQLRAAIATPDFGRQAAGIRRRLDILKAYRRVVEHLAVAFEGARSGLSRLGTLGRALEASEVHRRIVEVLEQESNLAAIQLSVRLGHDGGVRSVAIVKIEEPHQGRYYRSPLARLFVRLMMMIRGYRYTEEEALIRLLDGASAGIEDHLVRLVPLHFEVEAYLANLGFRDQARDRGLAVSLPTVVESTGEGAGAGPDHQLEGLFNPLLFLQDVVPVTCSVGPSPGGRLVVVTGPNSGGKTRLLQALALSQLLGQSGFFVPAARSTLPRLDGLFVSLTEAAAVDQREGRLGTELLRIRRLFERASFNSLIILDELCSGTNPSEGEEIIELVLSLLLELSPRAFLTTHFLKFAESLRARPPVDGLEFWQVELDDDEVPTYQFAAGVATTSLAQKTAARLGVTRAELLALIRRQGRGPAPPRSLREATGKAGDVDVHGQEHGSLEHGEVVVAGE